MYLKRLKQTKKLLYKYITKPDKVHCKKYVAKPYKVSVLLCLDTSMTNKTRR